MLNPDKKRVSLSLKKKTVAEFQEASQALGFPASIMSTICDEALQKTAVMFRKAKKKGGLTMVDLFAMIGEEVESIEHIEKRENVEVRNGKVYPQKTKGVEKKSQG
jgi:hypothetical protein